PTVVLRLELGLRAERNGANPYAPPAVAAHAQPTAAAAVTTGRRRSGESRADRRGVPTVRCHHTSPATGAIRSTGDRHESLVHAQAAPARQCGRRSAASG